MSVQIIQGSTGLINPATAILDSGWSVDGFNANHGGCNPGTMTANNTFGLIVGRQYVFTYSVYQYTSGGVHVMAGTLNGTTRSAIGTYTETLAMTGNAFVGFYADQTLGINSLSFYDLLLGPQSGRTISFHEKADKWVSEWSFQPEVYVKFTDKFFSFSNGSLWLQNVNTLMNNFFGVQYSSKVIFIFNLDYKKNKLWYNMRLDAIGGWYAPSLVTPPNDQFPNGMLSMISKKNIKVIDGKLWADILRDSTDPNFYQVPDPGVRSAMALFQGRMMQGPILIVTLQNDDVTPATLASAEAYYIDVEKSL